MRAQAHLSLPGSSGWLCARTFLCFCVCVSVGLWVSAVVVFRLRAETGGMKRWTGPRASYSGQSEAERSVQSAPEAVRCLHVWKHLHLQGILRSNEWKGSGAVPGSVQLPWAIAVWEKLCGKYVQKIPFWQMNYDQNTALCTYVLCVCWGDCMHTENNLERPTGGYNSVFSGQRWERVCSCGGKRRKEMYVIR